MDWPQNELTERLGLKAPILQAPMAGAATPALAAAVSAGGGSVGLVSEHPALTLCEIRSAAPGGSAPNESMRTSSFIRHQIETSNRNKKRLPVSPLWPRG